jgi:hypothetical protein
MPKSAKERLPACLQHGGETMEINSLSQQGLIARDRVWIAAFVFAFLGLMVDGADLMFLSYSLSSLKHEFGLSNIEAGSAWQHHARGHGDRRHLRRVGM